MKLLRVWLVLLLLLTTGLMAACGGEATPGPGTPSVSSNALSQTQTQAQPTTQANGAGVPTALPFFTPSAPAVTTPPGYVLTFDDKPGVPALEASVTTPLPDGAATDWAVTINPDGATRYLQNPRNKLKTQTEERYLRPEKLQDLLGQLDKLGVLAWPDTTAPNKAATGGATRNLSLNLKGRAKLITDLSGQTNDGLGQMLALVKQTVEAAPLRNSP